MMDIQAKIQQDYNENWVRVQNLKDTAQTLIFLQENNLLSYEKLMEVINEASKNLNNISTAIKEKEIRIEQKVPRTARG